MGINLEANITVGKWGGDSYSSVVPYSTFFMGMFAVDGIIQTMINILYTVSCSDVQQQRMVLCRARS